MQQPMLNPKDITDPATAMNMALALMAKAFKLNYSTPTNNNQRISSNPRNRQIAQPGMNMGQDRQMQMIRGNGNQNQIGNCNIVAVRAEGNAAGHNGNQIRCYNCRGEGHFAQDCTVRPRRRDATYLQTQLLIAQKEEAGIQLQAEDAPVYDSDGSVEFMGTVRFGNDHVAAILGFGDLQWGNILITRVYFVEGLDHNLFSVVTLFEMSLVSLEVSGESSKQAVGTAVGLEFPLLSGAAAFARTIRFGNDHIAAILGFGDLQLGNILIISVYFIEGSRNNLFSVRQFYDSDLEVAFRRNNRFVKNLKGVDLLKGNRTTNLYTINLYEMASASLIYLMARATSTNSLLWHQHLSYLNFDTINDLTKSDIVISLLKFKYHKEHLCPLCDQGKSKKASHPPKPVPNSKQGLHLLHMDLCGLMRVESINAKCVVISHQSSSVRTPQQNGVVKCRNRMLVEAARTMINTSKNSRVDNVMPNKTVKASVRTNLITVSQHHVISLENVNLNSNGISSTGLDSTAKIIRPQPRSNTKNDRVPSQNRVVKCRNRMLVEAARTMLIFSYASLFLWAKAIATACYTQNRSIIHHQYDKTPYELINGRKPDISFLHVFKAFYYPKNDHEYIGKLRAKGNIGFFIGYFANSCAYRVYNQRTKKIIETMDITFNELSAMAFE
nr:hypothetical protein [Tanacetum cinerariifolium]